MPNELVMAIAWPINLMCLVSYIRNSLQRTQSPPESHLPKRIGDIHMHNYYDLKGKEKDVCQVNWQHNYHDLLIWHCLCGMWTGGKVSALHSVVTRAISIGEDHSIHY